MHKYTLLLQELILPNLLKILPSAATFRIATLEIKDLFVN